MIVETSVLIAILLREEGYEEFVYKIAEDEVREISAASYLEASVVLLTKRDEGIELKLDRLIYLLSLVIMPVSATRARMGREAYLKYGKGRHPARLNFGDCFAYALAKQRNEPLLFKGNDFAQTDVLRA